MSDSFGDEERGLNKLIAAVGPAVAVERGPAEESKQGFCGGERDWVRGFGVKGQNAGTIADWNLIGTGRRNTRRGVWGYVGIGEELEEFHMLPYISPYEDCSGIDPESDLMEKRVVGVLHELLSLTIHKKTKRNYLRCLREEMSLPHKFTRVFTRYPGIFYLSLKCKTTTVMLREGYQRGKLVDPHPLALLRDKYSYVMRTGVLYRGKGLTRLVLDDEESVVGGGADAGGDGELEENVGGSNGDDNEDDGEEEYYEMNSSDLDDSGSDEN